ncbi:MAG: hypothetical protein L0Y42_02160, partial [Phycisphaerales bacterium]|nr:hypothetical protein [Phycisphaerales bacterium]
TQEWFSGSRNEPIKLALENNNIFASLVELPLADHERSSHNGSASVVDQHFTSKVISNGIVGRVTHGSQAAGVERKETSVAVRGCAVRCDHARCQAGNPRRIVDGSVG